MTGIEGQGGEGTAGLRCWLGERGSATLLTGQLHDCAAGWKRGTQLGERGAATVPLARWKRGTQLPDDGTAGRDRRG